MLRICLLFVLIFIAGCAQQKPKVNNVDVSGYFYQVRAAQVANGMSEAEVIKLMGAQPSIRSETEMPNAKIKVLGWSHYFPATGKAYTVQFQFVNDKLTGRTEVKM